MVSALNLGLGGRLRAGAFGAATLGKSFHTCASVTKQYKVKVNVDLCSAYMKHL